MERLPTEVNLLILHSISDFVSLYNLIRTSRAMYKAFQDSRGSTLASTLQQSLPTELLREACAVEACSGFGYWNLYVVRHTINKIWPRNPFGAPNSYPLPETDLFNRVARLHFAVEWFTKDLCKEFAKAQGSLNFEDSPLLPEKTIRIHRAFYRLELLCNLFRVNSTDVEWADLRIQFLSFQPLWEVEELTWVYEYLEQKLRSTLNVPWDRPTHPNESCPFFSKDLLISQGTTFLQKLFSTGTSEDPEKINSNNRIPFGRIRVTGQASCLQAYISQRDNKRLTWVSGAVENATTMTDPTAAWLIAQHGYSNKNYTFESCSLGPPIRSPNRWGWGYSLWSSARISSQILLS